MQEEVVRQFVRVTAARDCGNLARFLVAWPESTRGKRPFRPAGSMGGLQRFHEMAGRFLSASPARDAKGRITPAVLALTPKAKQVWVDFFNLTEERQRCDGDLRELPDFASKAGDQAARVAGIFHFWSGGTASQPVEARIVEAACAVAGWHLDEARRFLSAAMAGRDSDAMALDRWLIDDLRKKGALSVSRRELQPFGPGRLRVGKALDDAIELLAAKRRVRVRTTGKRIEILLNPGLF